MPYWGAHALSIQRYYQIACLLYGSNPDKFANLPATTGLPKARADGCIEEYARANRAGDWMLANYGRQAGDGPGAETEIVYDPPPTRVSETILRQLRSAELLERVTARLHQRFTLEKPFRIVLRRCGQAEAA